MGDTQVHNFHAHAEDNTNDAKVKIDDSTQKDPGSPFTICDTNKGGGGEG